MQLGRKGRTELSYSTLIIGIIVFLGAVAVLNFISMSTGQTAFLDRYNKIKVEVASEKASN